MSTTQQSSSFSRTPMNDLFSSILKPDSASSTTSSPSNKSNKMTLSPDMAIYSNNSSSSKNSLGGFSSTAHRHQHQHQRPVSEILKPESFASPETQVLDKWFEDLQQYESSLESMATASLDPKYKEEVQHVDQWFRYLNEAERTATIYTLLQHSTQVQIRFFSAVLQQMGKTDPLGALLSPAHPEKVDMQAQMANAMVKAELEASQKLLSVLPYQTGQVISRPNANTIGRRNHIDRHSFALGDTEEYDRLFSSNRSDFLSPSRNSSYMSGESNGLLPQQRMQRNVFERPKSVIEGDLSSIFSNDWSYSSGGLVNGHQHQQQQQQRPIASGRPKSADISNWSFGASVSSKSVRDNNKDPLASAWSGLSPTVATFGEKQQQQQQQSQEDDLDQLAMMANNWHLNNGGGGGSNRSSVILSDDTKGFRRRGMSNRTSIPGTVPETDETMLKNGIQSPPPPAPAALKSPANIVLSMYQDANNTTSKSLFGGGDPQYGYLRPTSPVPTQTKFNSNLSPSLQPSKNNTQQYGQFLNPNDRAIEENGYYSDHSESSNRSVGSTARGSKKKFGLNSTSFVNNNSNNNRNPVAKEKKNVDIVDMQLLEDVPAWLRSLRLHKYNPIFETMKWQDMLKMDDEALLGKGVAALGARRKLLKVFDQVKAHCQVNNITY